MRRTITLNEQNTGINFTKIFLVIVFSTLFVTTISSQNLFDEINSDWSNAEASKQQQEIEKIEVKIYPNPIKNNRVHIQLSKSILISTIKIYDILGKGVFTKKIESLKTKISLNPNLSSGIYIIKINTTNQGAISKKLIVQ